MLDLVNEIGLPATLEQCAEECTELAQACLKMARKVRYENPTPMTKSDILRHLNEEAADVKLCLSVLYTAGVLDRGEVNRFRLEKTARWEKRMKEFKEENKNHGV